MPKETPCHILPFFVPEGAKTGMASSELDADKRAIRGVLCIKKPLNPKTRVSTAEGDAVGPVFYWTPAFETNPALERGLGLVERGIGFSEKRNSVLSLLKLASIRKKRG